MVPETMMGNSMPHSFHDAARREQCRFGIQGIEDCFDQQNVDAARDQGAARFGVSRHQLIEARVAKSRVVDVRGERGGAAGRAEGARDEALNTRGCRNLVGDRASQPRRSLVQFADQGGHSVVGLRHRRGIERIGRDDVRSDQQIGAVNVGDDLRLSDREQVVVAAQIAGTNPRSGCRGIALRSSDDVGSSCPWPRRGSRADRAADRETRRGRVGCAWDCTQATCAATSSCGRKPIAWQMA